MPCGREAARASRWPSEIALSYAADEAETLAAVHGRWPVARVSPAWKQDLALPADFERKAVGTRPDDLADKLRISYDTANHVAWLRADAELGFDAAYLHHVGPDHRAFHRRVRGRLAARVPQRRRPPKSRLPPITFARSRRH